MRAGTTDATGPPALVIVTGVAAATGAFPGLLFCVVVLLTGGLGLLYATNPVIALFCIVLPWLLLVGAYRLMTRRSRWMLIAGGLPVTALALWSLLHDGNPALLLLMLGPAVAPFLAMAPSVGSWLAEQPFRVR